LWFIYGANSPDESRHISIHELSYIQATADKSSDEKIKSIRKWPIKSILTSRSVLVIIITNVLSDFTLYGIFSVFPLYLWEIYNMDVVTVSQFYRLIFGSN
jgi:sugar phosphate permease